MAEDINDGWRVEVEPAYQIKAVSADGGYPVLQDHHLNALGNDVKAGNFPGLLAAIAEEKDRRAAFRAREQERLAAHQKKCAVADSILDRLGQEMVEAGLDDLVSISDVRDAIVGSPSSGI